MVMLDDTNENMASSSLTSSITTLHPDIIQTHILKRLDAATLATAASVSSHLRRLCSDEDLWRNICTATWPSLVDPITTHLIPTFPGGHRSIFSDAFPSLHHHLPSHFSDLSLQPPPEIISAVDIYYKGNPIFSRVQRTETQKNLFLSSPFWVEMLEPEELVPSPVKFVKKNEEWLRNMEENLSLSWIVIDPTRKCAGNVSSRRPVSVRRHWLTREVEVVFAVAMAGEHERETEMVQCVVKVTCCGKVGGELHVREVSLVMEDMERGHVTGKEGVMILQRAMENGERKKVDEVEAMKESFHKFSCVVRERRERKHRIHKARDVAVTLLAFLALVFFCLLAGL